MRTALSKTTPTTNYLLLAMDTANAYRLEEANPIALPSDKLGRLISTLRARLGEDEVTLKRLYEAQFRSIRTGHLHWLPQVQS